MKILVLFLLMFLVSCAGYIDQVHRQIDREERGGVRRAPRTTNRFGNFEKYRNQNRFRPENDKRPINNPITYSLGNGPSGHVPPPVKREYRPRRHTAEDFVDSANSASLWANQGQSSSLFTYQNDKRVGDLVIINVLENLRNQISVELKRAFPDRPKKKDDAEKARPEDRATAAAPANTADNEMDMKVYDKISGFVAEEVSKDYIVLRGRKEVIFKKEKRSIEVQALVSRKDILENDYVNSDKLLDSRVFILRDHQ